MWLPSEVAAIIEGLADGSAHPNQTKRDLARRIVTLYWGEDAAAAAEAAFDLVHKRREIPDEVPEATLPDSSTVSLPSLIRDVGLAASAGEARRLVQQGAVKIDGEKLMELEVDRSVLAGHVLQVGKRRFVRLS